MKTRMLRLAAFAALLTCAPIGVALAQGVTLQRTLGTLVGVVRDGSGQPVASATVTARRLDAAGIRSTLSGNDGVFSFADVPAGTWTLGVQAADLPELISAPLEVRADRATRHDVALEISQRAPGPALAGSPSTAAPTAAAPLQAAPATAGPLVSVPATAQRLPEALQTPDAPPEHDTVTPFANVGYIGWMNGTSRESSPIFDTKFFTPEIRFDANYLQSLNHPKDHTIDGSTEEFRSGEFQIEQVSFGGDFHWQNVRARFLSMFGLFSVTTPRNDASQAVGQWDLQGAYKYFSEANAGYHFDVAHGLNVDAGIFVSYVGLFSYYNYDNWTYQPSFVSSNTPWFFNGLRIQYFPTQNLKIEPWIINGWQSYAKYNKHPGFGGQILWIPSDSLKLVFNTYTLGQDNLSNQNTNGVPLNAGANGNQSVQIATTSIPGSPYVNWSKVQRIHEDDSILVKYYDNPQGGRGITRMAFSLTVDVGCEYGGGVSCTGGPNKESFLGAMFYDRTWWNNNRYAITWGGGAYSNPGRYLALLPPINGATAATGTAYFSENPGLKLFQWDTQLNFQYMPRDWITWWTEATYRHSSVPYWSGPGGITAPGALPTGSGSASGNVTGTPGGFVCNNGTPGSSCAGQGGLWEPDLRMREIILGAGVMVRF